MNWTKLYVGTSKSILNFCNIVFKHRKVLSVALRVKLHNRQNNYKFMYF